LITDCGNWNITASNGLSVARLFIRGFGRIAAGVVVSRYGILTAASALIGGVWGEDILVFVGVANTKNPQGVYTVESIVVRYLKPISIIKFKRIDFSSF
jgi:hypothetical protein